jgi:hypothetical protein
MNQPKPLFFKSFIFLTLFISSNIILPKNKELIEKIKNLTTLTAINLEINKIKEEIRLERVTELIRIASEAPNTVSEKIMNLKQLLETTKEHYKELPPERQKLIDQLPLLIKIPQGDFDSIQKQIIEEITSIKEELANTEKSSLGLHDPNLPSFIYNDLYTSILEEKINPYNIQIEYMSGVRNEPNALASSNGFPPQIHIYEAFITKSENFQLFAYKHELFHIILRHSLEKTRIKFHYNSNLNTLNSIHEREANIHAASRNLSLAYTGKKKECSTPHSDIINQEYHCQEMTYLYELMKRKEELA